MKYLHAVGILASVLAGGAIASTNVSEAQDKPDGELPNFQPPRSGFPATEREPLVRLERKTFELRSAIAVAQFLSTQQIVIGEGVSGRVSYDGTARRLPEFLDFVCAQSGFSWGRIDADSIVILRARPSRPRFIIQQAPSQIAPPDVLRRSRPEGVPNGAQPFLFNGETVYRIPLQSKSAIGAQAEAKPVEIKPEVETGVATAR